MTREKFFLTLLVYLNKDAVVLPDRFKESDEEHGMVQENHRTQENVHQPPPGKQYSEREKQAFCRRRKKRTNVP